MIAFPSYVQVLVNGYTENYDSNYLRSEFERGVPKQRKISCQGLKQVTISVYVCDENYQDWLTFWKDSGRSWFEFNDPSTNPATKKKARIVAGDLNAQPRGDDFDYWTFDLILEMYA